MSINNKETFIHKKLTNNNSIEIKNSYLNNNNNENSNIINDSYRQLLNSNELKNINKNVENFSFESDFIKKNGCSAFYLGSEKIKQEAYLCLIFL